MPPDPILLVQKISKRFGPLEAVRGLSFELRAGEIFGFLGPNGAGKTTTLRMLMGITAPDSGVVRFHGRGALDRSRAGYLPEERGLFEDTPVIETLAYLGSLRGMGLAEARAAAKPWLDRLGLGDRIREHVGALSKGNQQKVQFIGAVLHRPSLVVLDEPFSGLDPVNQEVFSGMMRDLRDQGTAVLISAHQLDLVERLADRFLLISRGREVLSGTLDEMRSRAAGGMEETLKLHIAPPSGTELDAPALREELASCADGAQVEAQSAGDGTVRVEVLLPRGVDLGPLVSIAAGRGAILGIETRRIPLHEIYLRAVQDEGESMEESEVTSHA